ncbi:MAG: hypothetical protein P8129_00835 [Anaerolineae bacterium]
MSEQPQSQARQREESRQYQLLRTILALSAGAALVALIAFLVLLVADPSFPLPLVLIAAAFVLDGGVGLLLLRRREHGWAVGVYLVGLTIVAFAAIYFANGVQGPITVALILIPVAAGLMSGRRTIRWVLIVGGLYLIMASLEALGVIQPQEITGLTERLTYYAIFILVLALISYLVTAAAQSTRDALLAEEERGRQLAETSLQFERAARTEAQLRQREERIGWQLREAVARYSDYLGRVAAGDYEARLGSAAELVDAEGEAAGPLEELLILDRRIENTVQALVESLTNLQLVQRRYVQGSWADFARTGFQRDFLYAQEHVQEPAQSEGEWLASMEAAVREEQVTPGSPRVAEGELALPITLRGELLGAIGLRREGGRDWSEAELALAETIGDQLAQTMESLRLLDQTQRRAARDRLVSEVTARMRETLDMETVLKTTAEEMFRVLDLDEITVRLVPGDGAGNEARS